MTDSIGVLHVDDDSSFLDMTATFLNRESDEFEVLGAGRVDAARERLTESIDAIDCIVCDHDLPDSSGVEFLRTVRESHPELPFILFTGKGSEAVARDALRAGATDYLQKQSGTEQYDLLANRIRNAVAQSRTEQRAANLERVRELILDVHQALVHADSTDDVETRVCELFSTHDPYVTACIAGVDADSMRVEPRTWAGADAAYFEDLDMAVDDDAPGREAPGGRAYHDREIAVSQEIRSDPRYEPWRDAALERGFESLAVVPLEHEDTLYGLLAVYASRPDAFDDTEVDLLTGLGDDIAHALDARETGSELRRTASRLQALFEQSPDMINVHDADGNLIEPNPELCDRTGYSAAELTEMTVWELDRAIEPDEARALWAGMDVGDSRRVDGVYECRDGSTFPVEVHVRRLDVEGDPRFVSISREVTARRDREGELRRNERRLDAVFNHPNVLAGILAPDGTLLATNATSLEYIDESVADVVGDPFWETPWWSEDVRAEVRAHVDRAAAGEQVEYEASLTTASGDPYDVAGTIRPVTDESGDVVSLVVSARDVTARTAQAAELAETESRYRALAENFPNGGVFIFDTDLRYRVVSGSGFDPIVTDPDDLVGKAVSEVETYSQETVDTLRPVMESTIAGNRETIRLEYEGRVYELRSVPIRDDDGEVTDGLYITQDVTEQRERKRELERQNERLEEFASVVSHDLRNPLNMVEGRLELARAECDSDELDKAEAAVDRCQTLVEDLLTLARSGQYIDETEPVSLADVARRSWETVETADATLSTDGDAVVVADRSRFRQLLENLFRNAVDHAGRDVTVEVGPLEDGFFVADDGPGVPADSRDEVFRSGYSTVTDNTGFGLAIVSEIVAAHGWEVALQDADSGGARFEITGVEFE